VRCTVIIIHACELTSRLSYRMDHTSPMHAQRLREDFASLVSERHLTIDLISKTVVLSQGALWKHRMIRDPGASRKAEKSPPPVSAGPAIELRIFTHLLSLHQALLEVGIVELAEAPPEECDLAQRITAVFRRTLPALRIASKWLRSNFSYVMLHLEQESASDSNSLVQRAGGAEVLVFWETFARFSSALMRAFPTERLPLVGLTLEEDVDMRGFLPLKKMMGEGGASDLGPASRPQVHPNEEQLMRIADLLNDAKALVEIQNCPIALYHRAFVVKGVEQPPAVNFAQHLVPSRAPLISDLRDLEEDAMSEMTSRTDEDPVRAAFAEVVDGSWSAEDDDEDDEIVYPRATQSPAISPPTPSLLPSPSRQSPITPITRPTLSPIGTPSKTVSNPKLMTPVAITAQDLLLNVMGSPRPLNNAGLSRPPIAQPTKSSAPQPQLLFGSGPPNRPGHSIWSTSLDDHSLKYAASPVRPSPHHSPRHFSVGSHYELPQTIWSSQLPGPGQKTSPGGYSPSLAPPLYSPTTKTHGRVASTSHLASIDHHIQNDPFIYSSQPQPAVQRPGAQFAYAESPLGAHAPFGYPALGHDYRPLQDPRFVQPFAPPQLSQVWGNTG
jgi:protein SMG7